MWRCWLIAGVAAAQGLVFALPASAAGGDVPRFDVDGHCKKVANFGGTYSATIDASCFKMEQEAYLAVKGQWGAYDAKTRAHCDRVARFGGGGSYSILQSCLKMETDAAAGNKGRSFKY